MGIELQDERSKSTSCRKSCRKNLILGHEGRAGLTVLLRVQSVRTGDDMIFQEPATLGGGALRLGAWPQHILHKGKGGNYTQKLYVVTKQELGLSLWV